MPWKSDASSDASSQTITIAVHLDSPHSMTFQNCSLDGCGCGCAKFVLTEMQPRTEDWFRYQVIKVRLPGKKSRLKWNCGREDQRRDEKLERGEDKNKSTAASMWLVLVCMN